MPIEISLWCVKHKETELSGEMIGTKRGFFIGSCPLCQEDNKEAFFKEMIEKLLGSQRTTKPTKSGDIITVRPHVRKKPVEILPLESITEETNYHCANCGIRVDITDVDSIRTLKDTDGTRYYCIECAPARCHNHH